MNPIAVPSAQDDVLREAHKEMVQPPQLGNDAITAVTCDARGTILVADTYGRIWEVH